MHASAHSRMITPFKRTRAFQLLNHWRRLVLRPDYRHNDREARLAFRQFCEADGGFALSHNLQPHQPNGKTALIVSPRVAVSANMEAWVAKAFQMAGFNTMMLGERRYDFLRYYWLARNKAVIDFEDYGTLEDADWVEQQMPTLTKLAHWLALEYRGVHVGRLAVASAMRALRIGQLNFEEPSIKETMRQYLSWSVRTTIASIRLFDEVRPACVLIMDRGYSEQGEIFDIALSRGIDTIVWHWGYKSNRLAFRRYSLDNSRDHHLCPSAASWQRICSIPWKPEYGQRIRQELHECYKTQDWFSVVGTQFSKQLLSRENTRKKLSIPTDRKVAVIFPHILWDGSFFSGEDLFDDYTHWLAQTIRAACENPRIEWIIKLHPAPVVKANNESIPGRPQELDVIEREVGRLPAHVKLIYHDCDLSTYSLFEIADYTVTVRGTVGIEAALHGIPVVTAGTGRYDRRGFTLDSASQEEYLSKLASLDLYPRLTPEQIELAERYAFLIFCCQPFELSSVSLEYSRDALATPKMSVHCRTRQQWLASPDMRRLSAWIADRNMHDMAAFPDSIS
jgi:Capsule polysaccharide biosynthesis protein